MENYGQKHFDPRERFQVHDHRRESRQVEGVPGRVSRISNNYDPVEKHQRLSIGKDIYYGGDNLESQRIERPQSGRKKTSQKAKRDKRASMDEEQSQYSHQKAVRF